jgi:hypothetical protein
MAILLADGFDFYNSGTDMGYVGSPWANVGGGSISLTTPYAVGQSYAINLATVSITFTSDATIYLAFTHYCNTAFTGTNTQGFFIVLQETAGNQVTLHWSLDGNFYVRGGGTTGTIIAGPFAHGMAANSWCHWQAKVVINNTTGSVELRKNNNPVDDFSATNLNTRNGTTNAYANKFTMSTVTGTWNIDDLFVNSGSGAVPNSWPGQLRAIQLMPTADTAQKDLTPLSGISNYAMVDELKMDSNTSYVYGAVAGQTDIYNLADLTVTPTAIPLVVVRHSFAKSDTGARTATTEIRSGGVTQDQAAVTLATTYQWQDTYLTVDPNTSAAWTLAGVNALQVGPKVVS